MPAEARFQTDDDSRLNMLERDFNSAVEIRRDYEQDWQEYYDITQTKKRSFCIRSNGLDNLWTNSCFDGTTSDCEKKFMALFSALLTNTQFRWLRLSLYGRDPSWEARRFLQDLERSFFAISDRDGFYTMSDSVYRSLAIGNACPMIDERPVTGPGFQGLRCDEIPMDGVFFLRDGNSDVRYVIRVAHWTAYDIASYFGDSVTMPSRVKEALEKGDLTTKFMVTHHVRPESPDKPMSRFISTWACIGERWVIRSRSLENSPYVPVRIGVMNGSTYGTGPGIESLPSIRALNHMGFRKMQGVDWEFAPPTAVSNANKFDAKNLRPNSLFYLSDINQSTGIRTLTRQMNPQMMEYFASDPKQVVRDHFYWDQINIPMNNPEYAKAGVAAWINSKNRIVLAPELNSITRTYIVPMVRAVIQKLFKAIVRAGGRIPSEILDNGLNVSILGPLAQAQRESELENFDRAAARMSAIIQLQPETYVNVNGDRTIRYIAQESWMPTEMLNSPAEVETLKAQLRERQEQQIRQEQFAQGAAGAKDLAEAQAIARGQM